MRPAEPFYFTTPPPIPTLPASEASARLLEELTAAQQRQSQPAKVPSRGELRELGRSLQATKTRLEIEDLRRRQREVVNALRRRTL